MRWSDNFIDGRYKLRIDNDCIQMDGFYFKILLRDGSQAEQNGQKLVGRFVRSPSFDNPNQSNVKWYFVNWVFKYGEWKEEVQTGKAFTVRKGNIVTPDN